MVESPSSSSGQFRATGLRLAPAPRVSPLSRLAAKLRFSSALKSAEPPADDNLLPFYAEALRDAGLDDATRARLCRAIIYADGAAGRYVEAWIAHYTEAACAFSDDPACVLFVLSLLHSGVIDPRADLSFAQGVYAAALFFTAWEGGQPFVAFGLPPYPALRRELALLYAADAAHTTPERTVFVEAAYAEWEEQSGGDTAGWERARTELAVYLTRAYQVEGREDGFTQGVRESLSRWDGAPVPGAQRSWNDDPHDDPEAILRGGSGNPDDDLRIARRYVEEERTFDAAACALFARCVRYARTRGNEAEVCYWTVKLAHALIAVGRMDEDTRDILQNAAAIDPTDSLLELAYLYSFARDEAHGSIAGDSDLARRLEDVVTTQSSAYAPLAAQNRWDWATLERSLALVWGHQGRTDTYARTLYKKVSESYPDDPLLAVLYARALAQANVTDGSAIAAYESVVEMGKANEPVRRSLALAYARSGAAADDEKRPRALRLWEEVYRSGMAEDTDIALALADAYTREGRGNDVAIAVWEKAAKADPKNGTVRLRLARELRTRGGDALEAIKLFKEAARLLPEDFAAQYETGIALRDRSDEAGAIRFLRKAVALPAGATHKDAWFALGELLLGAAKRDEAMQVFEKILDEFDPEHSPTLLQMAKLSLRYEEGGAKRAEQLYGKALALDANNPEGHRRLALLHEEQGRFADAEAAWEQVLALSPPDAESTRKIADLYLKRGDFVKAESALRQTVALGGGDKKLFGLLGEVILQAQKQRDGKTVAAGDRTRGVEGAGTPRTRRLIPRVGAPIPHEAVATAMMPEIAAAPDPGGDTPTSPPKRQPIITQNSVPPGPAAAACPDSPASQNLTRSVGAAAIKAALRNRAARLAQPATDGANSQ